ncbi:MAG TPA: hypothetical protein VN604_06675 [Nitrospirota bacterium]|nr:hypothetical protein [Nitrospirota bacterium]
MKRTALMFTAAVILGFAFFIAVQTPAEADRSYNNRDLNGTYYYVTTQVRIEASQVAYCSGYGTITFDGIGAGVTDGDDRCSVGGLTHDTWAHTYSVAPDGIVLIREVLYPASVAHCRIVENGRMLLCDGTTMEPESLSFQAIAVKQ